jgi:hypothetical protein
MINWNLKMCSTIQHQCIILRKSTWVQVIWIILHSNTIEFIVSLQKYIMITLLIEQQINLKHDYEHACQILFSATFFFWHEISPFRLFRQRTLLSTKKVARRGIKWFILFDETEILMLLKEPADKSTMYWTLLTVDRVL